MLILNMLRQLDAYEAAVTEAKFILNFALEERMLGGGWVSDHVH